MTQVKKLLPLAVDILGLPQAIYVTKADETDRNGAIEMFIACRDYLTKLQNVLADSSYSGKNFSNVVKKILDCSVEVVKKTDLHSFKIMPKRWKELLLGLKKIAVFGRTANANFLLQNK